MSRRPSPLEIQHTNPFRQSIIARSETPFEPVPSMTNFGNSSAPSLSQSSASNPFGDAIEPGLDLEDCEDEDLLEEPPAYNEVVTGRQKRPVDEKRQPPADRRERRSPEAPSDRSRERRVPSDEKALPESNSGPYGRSGSHAGPSSEERERLEREHRRLIEREKYYRERRRELERRQSKTPEEQERDKERRRRRREARAAQEGSKGSSSVQRRTRSKSESIVKVDKNGRPLDTIDKMDVTGLFGPGGFHHDGPFDACNPHRNKKTNPRPPVAAFNIEGPNFSLAPGDVNEERMRQQTTVFGKYDDEPNVDLQPSGTTMGLGSTTFMDGTPASKDAIQEARQDRLDGRLGRSGSRRYSPTDAEPKVSLLGRVRSLRRPN